MTGSRRPISFIATSDAKDTLPFYRDVMGLTLIEDSPYALVFHDGEHMLRVQIVEGFQPVGYTIHGWDVEDIAKEIRGLASKGVEVLTFEHLDQDQLGIWTTPDGNKIAWFKDPSGNTLSLTEFI